MRSRLLNHTGSCDAPGSVGYVEDLLKLFLIQVNVTDVHAGELYMMADDPGEDHNVYELISDNVITKMANLTNVSGF